MFKILDVDQYFGPTRISKKSIRKIGYLLLSRTHKNGMISTGYNLEHITGFDHRIDIFWNKIKKHYNFIIERDRRYLNYRYCDPRSGKYVIFGLFEKHEMIGYIVLGEKGVGDKVGKILDLITLPSREDAIDYLIQTAFEFYSEKSIYKVNCWAIEGHPLRKSLLKHGFVSLKTDIPHIFFTRDAEQELMDVKNSSPEKLHFTIGDIDEL